MSVYLNEVCLQCNAELAVVSYLCGEKEVPFSLIDSLAEVSFSENVAPKGL